MAISLVMGALSTGIGVVAGTIALDAAATYFLVSTAMGVALNALAPKPGQGTQGYSISGSSGAALDHQIIYGETKVGGVVLYDCTTGDNNQFLHRILAFAGHKIDSYQKIYVDNELITLDVNGDVTAPAKYVGYLKIVQRYGTYGQNAVESLINSTASLADGQGKWTEQHTLSGIAYLYIRFKYDQNVFPNGVPVVNAIVRGKTVQDPRVGYATYSNNAVLCIRDYLTSDYGLNITNAEYNDTLGNAQADICDQVVASEARYTINGAFTTASSPKQILSNLLTACGGLTWNSEGMWNVLAASYQTPTITLTQDDLRSPMQISTRNSRRDNFNTVKGTFIGQETSWQEADYPPVTDPSFLTEDNGVENSIDFPLPFSKTAKTCQRIAKILLFRNREQITFSASFGLNALNCNLGDNIYFTNSRFGWISKVFEVTEWSLTLSNDMELLVNMTLREISSAVFNDVAGSVLLENNTNLPGPNTPAFFDLVIKTSSKVVKETVLNILTCKITSAAPSNIEKMELGYKLSTDTDYTSLGFAPVGNYDLVGVEDGNYDVRARSYNYFGYISDWTYVLNTQINNSLITVQDVTGFSGDLNNSSLTLSWDAQSDPDLSYYKIRHTIDVTGSANWADAVTVVSKVSRPASSTTVSVKPGTYLIKAVNKSGIESTNATSFVLASTQLETFTTNLTQTVSPTFTGTKSNTSVSSSKLVITDTTTNVPSSGSYTFTSYIDTGAVRKFRSRVDVTLTRVDNSPALVDNLQGKFDMLEGMFDSLSTVSSLQGDISVKTLISTTQTDPAGSPVWTAYTPFTNGQYTARAARFQVILSSESSNVTPSISALTATVQY
jgi:hypothetical protein